jgi:hypothetical protein
LVVDLAHAIILQVLLVMVVLAEVEVPINLAEAVEPAVLEKTLGLGLT